jgi:hypothetical protein
MVQPEELEQISQLLEGDLPPDAARSLIAEVNRRPELAEARRRLEALKATASTLEDGLSDAAAARLVEGVLGQANRVSGFRVGLAGSLGVAAAIAIVVVAVREGPTAPSVTLEADRSPATPAPNADVASPVVASAPSRHVADIRAAFASGNLKTAEELATQYSDLDSQVVTLRKQIEEYVAVSSRAETDPAAAQRVVQLNLLISGGVTGYHPKVASLSVAQELKEGLEAKSAGNLVKAYKLLQAFHDFDPGNVECRSALNEIKAKAHEIYMDAYTEKGDNPEDARRKFMQVIAMTPPDDENHIKAEARLKQLGP